MPRIDAGHLSLLSRPVTVAHVIERAARTVG
jgi:hypothetical protein